MTQLWCLPATSRASSFLLSPVHDPGVSAVPVSICVGCALFSCRAARVPCAVGDMMARHGRKCLPLGAVGAKIDVAFGAPTVRMRREAFCGGASARVHRTLLI